MTAFTKIHDLEKRETTKRAEQGLPVKPTVKPQGLLGPSLWIEVHGQAMMN